MATPLAPLILLFVITIPPSSSTTIRHETETNFRLYLHELFSGPNRTNFFTMTPNNNSSSIGATRVFNNKITTGFGPTSGTVGTSQGTAVRVSTPSEGAYVLGLVYDFTYGEYAGSTLSAFGKQVVQLETFELSIVGGTGKFSRASGLIVGNVLYLSAKEVKLKLDFQFEHYRVLYWCHGARAPPPPSVLQACRATRYPSVCEASLSRSASLSSGPIAAALSLSSASLDAARSGVRSLLDSSRGDRNRTDVAKKCDELLSYSAPRISAASRAVSKGSEDDVADARAWASAALLYQYACWSSLKRVNDTQQVAETMSVLRTTANHASNALSLVAALQRYGSDTSKWAPPQTERDGYWGSTRGEGAQSGLGSKIGVPKDLSPNATVCKNDGCEYGTVQSAVDAAPKYGSRPFVIHIEEGVYDDIVRIPFEKTNVVFVGDGMGRTVITGNLSMPAVSTYNTASVGVVGDGFMARDLTIRNTAGPEAGQAVAFRSDSDMSVIESVEFIGHQDTLYADSLRQLYKSCRIYGTVDFIFGNSAAVFEDCLILVVPRLLDPEKGEQNTVTAHGRSDPAQSTGFVFYRCIVNATDDYYGYYNWRPEVHRNYLGRPWNEYSRTVFIDCYLGVVVKPEGWLPWAGDFALSTPFYGEFGNKGPGSNPSARVPWSSQIPEEHLDAYSVRNFIQFK